MLNINLPYGAAVSLLGIYSSGRETYVHTKICTYMFTGSLFINSQKVETIQTSLKS